MVYLCKYCGTIANHPLTGLCEESPTDEHECVTGDKIEEYVQMIWERPHSDLVQVAGRK